MKATELINWRKVSIALSGHPEGVRSTYSGKKYKSQVNELKEFVESWLERNSKQPDTAEAGGKKNKNNLQDVVSKNVKAINFYKKNGFVEVGSKTLGIDIDVKIMKYGY